MRPNYIRAFAAMATVTLVTSAIISTSGSAVAQEQAAVTLSVGDNVPELKGIAWLQGDAVNSFDEKGKVYMLELWATWCGPCVAIIPHVNDLHKKYADKGLVVVGMNVWEDKVELPREFLKKQGDAMSYRVAYSGGSKTDFATNWLKPAGVTGIPHAFLIKDGKILYSGHPGQLEDSSIEAMLAGKYDAAAEAKKQEAAAKEEEALRAKIMPLFKKKDWDGILTLAKTLDDSNPAKLQLQLTAISEKGDWKALTELRKGLLSKKDSPITVSELDQNAALGMKAGEGAKEYAVVSLASFESAAADAPAPEQLHKMLMSSRLNFLAGNTDIAKADLATAKVHLENVDNPQMKQQLGVIFPAAEKALAEGSFPSIRELLQAK